MTRRSEDRPPLGRPERPGPVGAGVTSSRRATTTAGASWRAATRSTPNRKLGPDAVRQADRRAPSLRVPLAHRRLRLLRQEAIPSSRRLHLRRLLDRQDLGASSTTAKGRLAQGDLPTRGCTITGFGTDTHGEILIADHRGKDKGGLYTLEPTPKDMRAVDVPEEAERERPVPLGQGPRHGAGADPLLGQRAALVRRRRQGALARLCPEDAQDRLHTEPRLELPGPDGDRQVVLPRDRRKATRSRAAGSRRAS